MTVAERIVKLSSQLYPTGRAFKGPVIGDLHKLKQALAESEARFHDDARSLLNSLLPDNDDFTADDATDWERRLGLITSEGVALATRKEAIERKWNHPGTIKPRQNYRFLERELRNAGFDVYVYENRFAYGDGSYFTLTPDEFASGSPGVFTQTSIEHSDELEHGDDLEHGQFAWSNQIANYIEQAKDDLFLIADYKHTFFVGGSVAGTFANVDNTREQEFRQLILRTKPTQTVGFLLINYN